MRDTDTEDHTNSSWFASALDVSLDSDPEDLEQEEEAEEEDD